MAYSLTTGIRIVMRTVYTVHKGKIRTQITWENEDENFSGWGVEVEVLDGLETESVRYFENGHPISALEVYEKGYRDAEKKRRYKSIL